MGSQQANIEWYRRLESAARSAEVVYFREVGGLSFRELGERIGRSTERARGIYIKAVRKRRTVLAQRWGWKEGSDPMPQPVPEQLVVQPSVVLAKDRRVVYPASVAKVKHG